MVENLDIVPFVGFNISIGLLDHSELCRTLTGDQLNLLVSKVPVKTLKIVAAWTGGRICNNVARATDRLLRVNFHQLAELSMQVPLPSFFTVKIQRIAKTCGFPQLKTLKLNFGHSKEPQLPLFIKFLKRVLRSAPSLEQLQLQGYLELLSNEELEKIGRVLEGSRVLLVYDELDSRSSEYNTDQIMIIEIQSTIRSPRDFVTQQLQYAVDCRAGSVVHRPNTSE